jgi:hypothetical protein
MIKPWADRLLDNEVKGATVAMLAEIDELRASLDALKKQKPCASMPRCNLEGGCKCDQDTGVCNDLVDVYLAAGAQPKEQGCKYPTCHSADYQAELVKDLEAGHIAVPNGWVMVPIVLLQQAEESLGSFCSDLGWSQDDMDVMDSVSAVLAAVPKEQP